MGGYVPGQPDWWGSCLQETSVQEKGTELRNCVISQAVLGTQPCGSFRVGN